MYSQFMMHGQKNIKFCFNIQLKGIYGYACSVEKPQLNL